MDHATVERWLAGYERAWRAAGTAPLGTLFAEGATYQLEPYGEPIEGLAAIGEMWDAERKGADEPFTMTSSIVAVEGPVAVVRVEVHYADEDPREYRDLWVIRFAADGRCEQFEEWPFWPGRPRTV